MRKNDSLNECALDALCPISRTENIIQTSYLVYNKFCDTQQFPVTQENKPNHYVKLFYVTNQKWKYKKGIYMFQETILFLCAFYVLKYIFFHLYSLISANFVRIYFSSFIFLLVCLFVSISLIYNVLFSLIRYTTDVTNSMKNMHITIP